MKGGNALSSLEEVLKEKPKSAEDLEYWLLKCSLLIRSGGRREDYEEPEESTAPRAAMYRKLLQSPHVGDLPRFYARLRTIAARFVRTVPEGAEKLRHEIDTTRRELAREVAALRVPFAGSDRTLQEIRYFLQAPDRSVRQKAYEAASAVVSEAVPRLGTLFKKLHGLRVEMARAAGFESYAEYRFAEMRRDYDPSLCRGLHTAVVEKVVPALSRLVEKRARFLKLGSLKPWDVGMLLAPGSMLDGAPLSLALAVIEDADLVWPGALHDVTSGTGVYHEVIRAYHTPADLDLNPVLPVTAPTSRVSPVHSLGHIAHYRMCRGMPLVEYREPPPYEVTELMAMVVEWIPTLVAGGSYIRAAAGRAISSIASATMINMFESWLYARPFALDAAGQKWLDLVRTFFPNVDVPEDDEAVRHSWLLGSHSSDHPFGYVDVAIAALGAAQVALENVEHPKTLLRRLPDVMRLGLAQPAPTIYGVVGATWAPWEKPGLAEQIVARILETALEG